MSPEAQRIAIAEACGWPKPFYESKDIRVGGKMAGTAIWNLPDYLNDLNAMHETERILMRDMNKLWYPYCRRLHKLTNGIGEGAAAPQRAEAFLKTLGLWKE
jgi:hypothetical protein